MQLVEGAVLGAVEGAVLGLVEGDVLGATEGDVLGLVEGDVLGLVDGDVLGAIEGDVLGLVDGDVLEEFVGAFVLPAAGTDTPPLHPVAAATAKAVTTDKRPRRKVVMKETDS